jgi:hypothetical protein
VSASRQHTRPAHLTGYGFEIDSRKGGSIRTAWSAPFGRLPPNQPFGRVTTWRYTACNPPERAGAISPPPVTTTMTKNDAPNAPTSTPGFLTLDPRVPATIRDLLGESDGCLKHNFLTGATACAQRAMQALLAIEKVEGPDVPARIRGLNEKYPAVPQMLSSVLLQFGDATSRDGAKLTASGLNLLIVTLKAVLYEIYVLGPERAERLDYVRQVFDSIERKGNDKRPAGPTPVSVTSPAEKAS